jgi:hypothetical protein
VAHGEPVDSERDERGCVTGADHARVAPRARREALRAEMDRLEEVRLTRTVLTRDEDDARGEAQIERRVRAEAPERDVRDVQAARLPWFTPRGGSA